MKITSGKFLLKLTNQGQIFKVEKLSMQNADISSASTTKVINAYDCILFLCGFYFQLHLIVIGV